MPRITSGLNAALKMAPHSQNSVSNHTESERILVFSAQLTQHLRRLARVSHAALGEPIAEIGATQRRACVEEASGDAR